MEPNNQKVGVAHRILTVVGIVLCVVFGAMLICNIVIIVKGTLEPDKPPAVLGVTPMVVLSGSMSGDAPDHIEIGDLIFVDTVKAEDLKEGDVIAYMEGKSTVTHRIIEVTTDEEGGLAFRTKGDANNTEDKDLVTPDHLIGIYMFRIPKVGDFALFLQEPLGMVLFIGVPLLAFIIYDIIRRQRTANRENAKTSELEAELARLRALAGETTPAEETSAEETPAEETPAEETPAEESVAP